MTERRSRARVLVVEHNEALARIVLHSLKNERIEGQWIPLANIRHCINNWKPQLILIGDDLDGQCGIDLCEQIRASSIAPILILTECEAMGHHIRAFNAGADDVIIRPVCPPLLVTRVLSHLRRAYRYSGSETSSVRAQRQGGTALLESGGQTPVHNTSTWPTCRNCNYMGPRSQFEKARASSGAHACPACGEGRHIMYAPGKFD